jgi:hypothetical protein
MLELSIFAMALHSGGVDSYYGKLKNRHKVINIIF